MLRFQSRWLGTACLIAFISTSVAKADEPSLAKHLPPGAIAYVEVAGLSGAIDTLRAASFWEKIYSSPMWDVAAQTPQYKRAQAGIKLAEAQLGMDVLEAAKGLFGKRLAIALYPNDTQKPDAVTVIRVADTELLKRIRDRAEALATLFAPEALTDLGEVAGCRLKSFRGNAFYFVRDDLFALASTQALLTTSAELLNEGSSLATDALFQRTMQSYGQNSVIRGYINSRDIIAATNLAAQPRKLDNALASLLVGGILELAVHCECIGVDVGIRENSLDLEVRLGGDPGKLDGVFGGFFNPADSKSPVAIPRLPNVLGGLTIYRDFKALYQGREALMHERALPGFDKFETGLASLLPGKDFAEDVLATFGKRMTFVVAEQSYDYLDGKPGVQLPGFAMIVDLEKPQEGADLFRLLFQTVVGISNIQAGQQGRQPMILAAEEHQGIQIQYGRLLSRPSGEQLPVGFNFTPASALVKDQFVMSSSLELCKALVDHLQQVEGEATPGLNFELDLFPRAIASIFESNRDVFRARMIQEGRTPERAEEEFSLLLEILRCFEAVRLSHVVQPESFDMQLEVRWQ